MSIHIPIGSTDRTIFVRGIVRSTGAPSDATTLAANVTAYYARDGGAATEITPVDLDDLDAAHADGGWYYVAYGWYRFDLSDAVFAAGASQVAICITASGPVDFETEPIVLYSPITVTPLQSTVSSGEVADGEIVVQQASAKPSISLTITDEDGTAVDLSAATLRFLVFDRQSNESVFTVENANITVGGNDGNEVTVPYTTTNTATAGTKRYELWRVDTGNDELLAKGRFVIRPTKKVGDE